MDLGRAGIDHIQADDRGSATRPEPPPTGISVGDPGGHRRRRPRREWYRGTQPSEFDEYVLAHVIVPARFEGSPAPMPPWRYFEDEVEEARGITRRWMPLLLHGMDYAEILAWHTCLDTAATSFLFPYPDAPDHAIALHAEEMTPHDLRWRPEDEGWGTLAERLRRHTMTIAEVIVEIRYRRADDGRS